MATRTLTVAVPADLYDRLEQQARQAQRSVEDEVVLVLTDGLPPHHELHPAFAGTLASLKALEDDALWRLARSRVGDDDAARLAELGDKRQRDGLSEAELHEADALVRRHDHVLVLRAEAAALLKARGHDVSTLMPKA